MHVICTCPVLIFICFQIGEFATDYIELRRDVADCSTFGFSRPTQGFRPGDAENERHAQDTMPNGHHPTEGDHQANGHSHHETGGQAHEPLEVIKEKPENGDSTPP